MIKQDVVILSEKEHNEMVKQVDKVMDYTSTVNFYDHNDPVAQRRGFMAELVCRRLMMLPIELGVGPDEYNRGYDIKLKNKQNNKRVYIDVKSGLVKSSWSPYTQQRHDLKLHRFKEKLPDDFMYVFISGTDDPYRWIIEGCCSQKEIKDAIKNNDDDVFGFIDEYEPHLVRAGQMHRNFLMDHDTVIVPNMWLPSKGSFEVLDRIGKMLSEDGQ